MRGSKLDLMSAKIFKDAEQQAGWRNKTIIFRRDKRLEKFHSFWYATSLSEIPF